MGWLFSTRWNRKSLIQELTLGFEKDHYTDVGDGQIETVHVKTECLAKCYRGCSFSGVLWSVWQQQLSGGQNETRRYIRCDVLKCVGGEWGYKDIDEGMHPYYYSCPKKYLNMVPIHVYGGNAEWRTIVMQHHEQKRQKRKEKQLTTTR